MNFNLKGAQQFPSGKRGTLWGKCKFVLELCTTAKAQGTTAKAQGTTAKAQGTTAKAQGTTAIAQGTKAIAVVLWVNSRPEKKNNKIYICNPTALSNLPGLHSSLSGPINSTEFAPDQITPKRSLKTVFDQNHL